MADPSVFEEMCGPHYYDDAARFDDDYRSWLDEFSRQQQQQQQPHPQSHAVQHVLVGVDLVAVAATATATLPRLTEEEEEAERTRRLLEEAASGVYDDDDDDDDDSDIAAAIVAAASAAAATDAMAAVAAATAADAMAAEPLVVVGDDVFLLDEGVVVAEEDDEHMTQGAVASAVPVEPLPAPEAADVIPPEQAAHGDGRIRVGTLVLDSVSVRFEANWHTYWVAKNQYTLNVDYDTNRVTIMGRAQAGQPGADVWCDVPAFLGRCFVFSRVELHNGARLEFDVRKQDELCLNEVFCRSHASKALEFWLGDHCSVINMPTLHNDQGASQRTVAISLGHRSIFAGKTGATIDHLDLHVRPGGTEAELKSYFVKASARGVFDAVKQVKIRLGALEECSLDWKVNVADKRAQRWKPRVKKAETAPHSDERRAASNKDSRQAVAYRMQKWFSQMQKRISSIRAAAVNCTVLPDPILLAAPLADKVPPQYEEDIADILGDFDDALRRYRYSLQQRQAATSTSCTNPSEMEALPSSSSSSLSTSSSSSSSSRKRSHDESVATDSLIANCSGSVGSSSNSADDNSCDVDYCIICKENPASLYGHRCGHAYYCSECDQMCSREQPLQRYLQCPLCRRSGQRLVPKEQIERE